MDMMIDVDPLQIAAEMRAQAKHAADKMFTEHYDGRDQYPCGFAWVAVTPKHRANTRLGRVERRVLENMGFEKSCYGRSYIIWNPGAHNCQNMYVKYEGARAAAMVLSGYGFQASAASRLD